MRLVFTEPAERDLDGIIDYIALDNPSAAERVYRAIVATAQRLTDFPEMARKHRQQYFCLSGSVSRALTNVSEARDPAPHPFADSEIVALSVSGFRS